MENKFEKYIKEKASQSPEKFEGKEMVWQNIAKIQSSVKRIRVQSIYKYAALAIILLSVAAVILLQNKKDTVKESYFNSVNNKLQEIEIQFANEINIKYNELDNYPDINKEYFDVFFMELNFLDEQYQSYEKELTESGFHETIIEAMIENQKMKLQVLKKLLSEIKKVKNYENQNNQIHI